MSLQLNDYRCAGNLTRDPEHRVLPGDRTVCNLGLAIHRRWKNQSTQELQEETTFVDVEAWGMIADFIGGHFSKGDAIYLSGHLKLKSWEDKDGQKRSKIVVVAEEAKFVLNKPPARAAADARQKAQQTEAAPLPPRAPVAAGVDDEPPF